jgi:hypothetical protein
MVALSPSSTTNPRCQTTTGYIIRREYIDTLLDVWKNTVSRPENIDEPQYSQIPENTIDHTWKMLQKRDESKWIIVHPPPVYQGESYYSDILLQNVNYGV